MSDGAPYITYIGSVMRLYNFPLSSTHKAIVGCYDNIPFRFYTIYLIDKLYESQGYPPELIGSVCREDEDEMLKKYCSSISDSYSHKYEYLGKFRRDLEKEKFIFKIQTDLFEDLREYYIKVFDITDPTKCIMTHSFQGRRILSDHYVEIFEKYHEVKKSKCSFFLETDWCFYLKAVIGICGLVILAIRLIWQDKE
ncbi:hypothetical protein P3W45_001232 [Vairimorpha bombi]|jgi:hypothetical protein